MLLNRRQPQYVVAQRRQITFVGDAVMPEISPDGKYLAFVRPGPSRASRLVLVQDLAGGAPITVFEDKGVWDLQWSPDGSELLFSAFNDSVSSLVVVPRMGGSFRRYSIVGTGSTWSPDGTRFATVAQRIYFIDKKTGDTSSIPVDTVIYDIDWSPNGEWLALSVTDSCGYFISTCDIQGRKFHRITDSIRAISPKWSANGDAIYFLEDKGESPPNLYKIRVDAKNGERKGDPILLVSSLQGGQYLHSISADDRKLVFRQQVKSSNLWLVKIGGPSDEKLQTAQLTSGTSEVFEPSLSPDGSQIAFAMTVQEEVHIFTIPVEGGSPKQITHTNTGNRFPVWSPDGRKIAYTPSTESPKIAVIDAKGGMPTFIEQSIYADNLVWSPGERILCRTGVNCELLDPASGTRERLLADDVNGYVSSPCYSPDGSKVALIATEYEGDWHLRGKTKKELVIYSVADHSKLWSMTPEPGLRLLGWSQDGRRLYFALVYEAETTVNRLRIDDRTTAPMFNIPWGDLYDIVMGADCSTFVCVRGKAQSDIWMIENFDPDVR
jgi:Tol biopolymer transport system component